MICHKCNEENLKSQVFIGGGSMVTLMTYERYYDEDGKYHAHDPNKITRHYSCSNGHTWTEVRLTPCHNCDYGKDSLVVKYETEETDERRYYH